MTSSSLKSASSMTLKKLCCLISKAMSIQHDFVPCFVPRYKFGCRQVAVDDRTGTVKVFSALAGELKRVTFLSRSKSTIGIVSEILNLFLFANRPVSIVFQRSRIDSMIHG